MTAPAADVEMVPQLGHTAEVDAAVFLPDGRRALTGGDDGTVKLWDTETGMLVRSFPHAESVHRVALSADGTRALSASRSMVRLWDLDRGTLVRTFARPGVGAWGLAFLPDGRRALIGGEGTVDVVDLDTGATLRTFAGHTETVLGLAVAPDGRRIASAADRVLHVWDLDTGEIIRSFENPKWLSHAAFSPDGQTVLFGGLDTFRIADIATGAEQDVPPLTERVRPADGTFRPAEIRFTSEGTRLYIVSRSGMFSLQDDGVVVVELEWPSLRELHRTTAPTHGDGTAAISPDGERALVANTDDLNCRMATQSTKCEERPDIAVIDIATGRRARTCEGRITPFTAAAYSADGLVAVTGDDTGLLHLWDTESGARVRTFGSHPAVSGTMNPYPDVTALALSQDGTRVLSGSRNQTAVLWDMATGAAIRTLRYTGYVRFVALSQDGRRAFTAGSDYHRGEMYRVWDLATGDILAEGPLDGHVAFAFSRDERFVVSSTRRGTVIVRDLQTGEQLAAIDAHVDDPAHLSEIDKALYSPIVALALSPDDANLATASQDGTVKRWQLATGRLLHTLPQRSTATTLAFARDGMLLIGSRDGTITVADTSGTTTRVLTGHTGEIVELAPSGDGKHLMSSSADGTLRVWRLETGASFAMAADSDAWVLYDDAGRFDAARGGGRLVAALSEGRTFRIDQLAARRNRPDLVLAPVGLASPELLAHYRERHAHRLRKLGIADRANATAAPTARITGTVQRDRLIDVTFELTARGAPLHRYNVYVDDVPLLGGEGAPTSGLARTVRHRVELAAGGSSKLEVAALDADGNESLRDVRVLDVPGEPQRDLYVLLFGVSRYRDPGLDLGYAHKDARDLAAVFARMRGTHFREVHGRVLVDAAVTRANIAKVKRLLGAATVDDTVVVFVAGHGTYAQDTTGDYFLLTHDTDLARLRETAAPFELVEDLLRDIAPRRKLLLLDACESGERDEAESMSQIDAGRGRGMRARGLVRAKLAARRPSTPPRRHLRERERYIYNDLARRTGAIVFSSSRGSEISFERDDWRNGAFTAELVRALSTDVADQDHDRFVTTEELRRYVSTAVAGRTGDLQHPTVDRDNLEAKFGFPIVRP